MILAFALTFVADAPDPVVTLLTGLLSAGVLAWQASQSQQLYDHKRRLEDLEKTHQELAKELRAHLVAK